MAEKKSSTNVTHLRAVTEKTAPGPKSLEERLEEARAKRARILAAKGTDQTKRKGPSKPWLDVGQTPSDDDEFDPAARAASLSVEPEQIPLPSSGSLGTAAEVPVETGPDSVQPESEPPAEAISPPADQPVAAAERTDHRVVRAGLLGLVGGLALVAGAAVTNIDRLPEIVSSVAPSAPAPVEIAMSTAPVPKTYLGWDPTVLRPSVDTIPVVRSAGQLAPFDEKSQSDLPERGVEFPLAARLAIGAATLDIPPGLNARIRVFAPADLPADDVEQVTDFLAGHKLQLGAVTPVTFKIESNQVRYFHRNDRETARALSRLLGASLRQYPFNRDNPVETGIIEIWIAGE